MEEGYCIKDGAINYFNPNCYKNFQRFFQQGEQQGTSVIMGIRHALNIESQVCVKHWLKWGASMHGTLVTLGTEHAWNVFRWVLDMPWMFGNFEIRIPGTSFTFGS